MFCLIQRGVAARSAVVPPRYAELRVALETSVSGVLYGAIYSTLVTQTLKSVVILAMNLIFGVPLAAALAIISFIIGFFPIVGSWSVYVPVALWLLVFRGATVPAVVMVTVGFLLNTLFISMHQDGRTLYPGSGFPSELGGPNAFGTTINLPKTAPDTIASVIKLVVKGKVASKIDMTPKKEMNSGALD